MSSSLAVLLGVVLLAVGLLNLAVVSRSSFSSSPAATASSSSLASPAGLEGALDYGTPAVILARLESIEKRQESLLRNLEALAQSVSALQSTDAPAGVAAGGGGGGCDAGKIEATHLACLGAEEASRLAREVCSSGRGAAANNADNGASDSAAASPSAGSPRADYKVVQEGNRASTSPASTRGTQEARRARLLQRLQNHVVIQREIRSGVRPPRYVRCPLLNGWGNVLQEAVSCMLLALSTERAIIFDIRPITSYIPFAKFLNPDNFMPFQDAYSASLASEMTKKELVVPRHNWTCIDWEKELLDVEVIGAHLTYDWWASNMLANPLRGDQLLADLPRDYFKVIFGFCFKLAPSIQAEVDEIKRKHFTGYTIGLQIRSASSKTLQGKVDHKGFPVAPIDLYAQTAKNLENFQDEVPASEVKWFMATQNAHMIDYLKKAYGAAKIISLNGTVTTTFDVHEEGQRLALMTWWLLGETDDVLTSEASSYGTTAAVRTGITPIVCNHKKYCSRRLTPTPCQDTKFLVEQPTKCHAKLSKMPHHFLSSPESTCGYWKHAIYASKEYQAAAKARDAWKADR